MITNNLLEKSTKDYNWTFATDTGTFVRWGATELQNSDRSPLGPEVLDVEVSTQCHGINEKLCPHCYTNNTENGKNMSLETFQALFDLVSSNLTVMHFNIGDTDANFDLGKMMKYALSSDVTAGITITGQRHNDLVLYDLAAYAGYVDVSFIDKELCYNTIAKLSSMGIKKINMRLLLSNETFSSCSTALSGIHIDHRLDGLNAVKIDLLRPVNRASSYHQPTEQQFKGLLNMISVKRIPFAVSPCLGGKLQEMMFSNYSDLKNIALESEPCEAGLFKGFININGSYFPCPFAEPAGVQGISVLDKDDFVSEVWNGQENREWQEQLLTIKRTCPLFV